MKHLTPSANRPHGPNHRTKSDELHGNESPAERATDAEVSPATAVDEVMDGSRACDVGYIVDIVLEDVGVTGHQRVGAGTLSVA